jgi:MFS family permease
LTRDPARLREQIATRLTFFIAGFSTAAWAPLVPLAKERLQLDEGSLGLLLLCLGLAFVVAMTLGRLTGDRLRTILGEQWVLIVGGILAAVGFSMIAFLLSAYANLVGFLLVGAGASNIVPVLFSVAGRTRVMPPSLAMTAVTTLGYLGILVGPALIGFIAHLTDLRMAFALLVAATLFIAASFKVGNR